MNYDLNGPYGDELKEMSNVLELINYRSRTTDSYLYSISLCCKWLAETYGITVAEASVAQLREHLVYLHRPVEEGGRGYKPRSVNISNCAIKRYFQYVLKKPLTNHDLPIMKVDNPLPKVPGINDAATLIMGTENLSYRTMFALAFGCALRMTEIITLHFGDISFSKNLVTIRAEFSKNRCEETVELPSNLKALLLLYYRKCCPGAKSDDWLFPGRKPGSHISKGTPGKALKGRILELGWSSRRYTFHSLRHAHALAYYLSGADIYQVQVRLRHKSISSTTVYVRLAGKLQERRHIENPFDDPAFKM